MRYEYGHLVQHCCCLPALLPTLPVMLRTVEVEVIESIATRMHAVAVTETWFLALQLAN